ncbi:rhodanese-like domain-containing protein [uncultured Polaribacter sp.]|uniref:rhodanese-like domain-containing protein n=1 Tax=uncultured Polaribacter sp. TaxID=174711 RepID=UPI00260653AC|nr:rhodanese-like domain-containing protein [uncultured Polaribacter sp.]
MKNLPQQEWRTQLTKEQDVVVLDVRTPEECATGIVENAIMIDFLQPDYFMQEVNKLDKSKNYYVYCRSGNRSGKACQLMENLGFNESFNLLGGMNEWNAEKVSPN